MNSINNELLDKYDEFTTVILQGLNYESRGQRPIKVYNCGIPLKEFDFLMHAMCQVAYFSDERPIEVAAPRWKIWRTRLKNRDYQVPITKTKADGGINLRAFYETWIRAGREVIGNPNLKLADITRLYDEYDKFQMREAAKDAKAAKKAAKEKSNAKNLH